MTKYHVTIIFDKKDKEELSTVTSLNLEGNTLALVLEDEKRIVFNWDKITYYIWEVIDEKIRR